MLLPMIDLVMDLCALCAVQLSWGAFCLRKLLLAEAVLLISTLLCARGGPPHPAVQLGVYLLSAAVLTGSRRPIRIIEAALCLFCAFLAAGGIASLGGGQLLPIAPLGALVFLLAVRKRRNTKYRWNVDLYVELDGAGDWFPALIDSGNRLRDHRSGYPVLIVEASAVPRFAAAADRLDPSRARTLPFGVLGSAGELRCFLPDRLELQPPGLPPVPAPPCLVALFPGRIPGSTRALAPPEFIDAAPNISPLANSVKFRSRRFRHGIF